MNLKIAKMKLYTIFSNANTDIDQDVGIMISYSELMLSTNHEIFKTKHQSWTWIDANRVW